MMLLRRGLLAAIALLLVTGIARAQDGFSDTQGGVIFKTGQSASVDRPGDFLQVDIDHPSTRFSAKASYEVPAAFVTLAVEGWACFQSPIDPAEINKALRQRIGAVQTETNFLADAVAKTILIGKADSIKEEIEGIVFSFFSQGRMPDKTSIGFWPENSNFSATQPNCYAQSDFDNFTKQIKTVIDQGVEAALAPLRDELGRNPLEQGDRERIQ